jgi:hypothetical protein
MFGNLIECREHEFFITILHRNALLTLQWKQSKCRKEDRFTKIQDLLQRLYVSHCSYWTVLPVLNCSLYWSSKGCSFFIQLEETRTSWFFVWFWRNRNSSSKCWRYSSSQCAYERHSPPPLKIFKMADVQGECLLHFDQWRIIANHGVAVVTLFWLSRPSVCLYSVTIVYHQHLVNF